MKRNINVSIVYACPDQQWLHDAQLERGSTARDLVQHSGFLSLINELQVTTVEQLALGVYAERIDLDYLLEDGDRVEIYRPLMADPKDVRRQLAKLGKTMGNK